MWLLCNFVTLLFSWLFLSPAKFILLFNPWSFKFQWLYFSFSEIPFCTLLELCGQFWESLVPLVFIHFSVLSTFIFLNLIIPFSFEILSPRFLVWSLILDWSGWFPHSWLLPSLCRASGMLTVPWGRQTSVLVLWWVLCWTDHPSACQVPYLCRPGASSPSSPLMIHRLAFCRQISMTLWPGLALKSFSKPQFPHLLCGHKSAPGGQLNYFFPFPFSLLLHPLFSHLEWLLSQDY